MSASLAQQGPVIPEFERGSDCVRENGQFCADWFFDNFDRVFAPRLVEHIELTAIAVGIGFVIAFARGAHRLQLGRFETPVRDLRRLPLHDPQPGLLPADGPDHGATR